MGIKRVVNSHGKCIRLIVISIFCLVVWLFTIINSSKILNFESPARFLDRSLLVNTNQKGLRLPLTNSANSIKMADFGYLEYKYTITRLIYPNVLPEQEYLLADECNRSDIKNVWTQPIRWIGRLKVILDGSFSGHFAIPGCGYKSDINEIVKVHEVQNAESICVLFIPDGNSFQHFILDTLPKIVQAYDILRDNNTKLVLQKPRENDRVIIENLLRALRLFENVLFKSDGYYIEAKYMLNSCNTPPLHPMIFQEARRLIGGHKTLQVSLDEAFVLFISRKVCNNCGRNIVNEDEFLGALHKRYGRDKVIVHHPMHSVDLLIRRFSRTKLIIGVNGGGFLTMLFATSQTAVLEITPTPFHKNTVQNQVILWLVALQYGMDFWKLYEKALDDQNNVKLDMKNFNKVLDEIDHYQAKKIK